MDAASPGGELERPRMGARPPVLTSLKGDLRPSPATWTSSPWLGNERASDERKDNVIKGFTRILGILLTELVCEELEVGRTATPSATKGRPPIPGSESDCGVRMNGGFRTLFRYSSLSYKLRSATYPA
jgi:hypothetical protein